MFLDAVTLALALASALLSGRCYLRVTAGREDDDRFVTARLTRLLFHLGSPSLSLLALVLQKSALPGGAYLLVFISIPVFMYTAALLWAMLRNIMGQERGAAYCCSLALVNIAWLGAYLLSS